MAREYGYLHSNVVIPNVIDLFLSRRKNYNPDEMTVDGLICFCGVQGSGKTLSAVLYAKKLMDRFPRALLCTNLSLNFDVFDTSRCFAYKSVSQMQQLQNGSDGIIFLLDEIQIEFNSLESKQASIPVFELVCQQRKQRKHIIGTTQVFARLAKPFREQFKYCVLCDNYFGTLFKQTVYSAQNVAYEDDVRTELTPKCVKWYIPCCADFGLYDTYEVVKRVGGGLK